MSVTLEVVYDGSSVEVDATIEDYQSTPENPLPVTPDSNVCKIYDAAGTLVTTSTSGQIVNDGPGLYHFDTPITIGSYAPGKWKAVWIATKSSLPSVGEGFCAVVLQ